MSDSQYKELVKRLRAYDIANHRGKYAQLRDASIAAITALLQERKELRAALQKIHAFDPGVFRPLADEIAIFNIAAVALEQTPGLAGGLLPSLRLRGEDSCPVGSGALTEETKT